MHQHQTASRTTPLTVHCECDHHACHGEVVDITTAWGREIYIRCDLASVCPPDSSPAEQARKFYTCLPRILERAGATMAHVIQERVFFRDLSADHETFVTERTAAFQQVGVPPTHLPVITCVEQPPCDARQAFEIQAYALVPNAEVPATQVSTIDVNHGVTAKIVKIDGRRHLYVGGITAPDPRQQPGASLSEQCTAMFARAAHLLEAHGASIRNVLRTWCYLEDIDRDYGEFNAARTEFFRQHQVDTLPASTGIRAGLRPAGARCALDLYALLDTDGVSVDVMHAATLNEAPAYGSSFSRGIKLTLPEKTVLFVSGTASVDELGATVHTGDARRQIERMLLNVEKLLAPHEAGFQNIVQVISYLKSADDLDLFRALISRWGLADMPNSIVTAGVCRPDLLCEMEAIAILPAATGAPAEESALARPESAGNGSGLASTYFLRSDSSGQDIPDQLNAATVFVDAHVANGRGAKTAILCEERAVTYDELLESVNRAGNALRALDVRMEERVAILLPDSPEWVIAFFGAMKIGAVAIPLNTNLKPEDYLYVLNDCRARVLFVHAELAPMIEAIHDRLTFLESVVVVDGAAADAGDGRYAMQPLLTAASPTLEPVATSKDDAAFWLYSSGTTGPPKGAIHLHHDMLVEADLYSRGILGLNDSDVSFSVAKLFFAFGLGNGLYFPLRSGGTTVLLPGRPTPDRVFAVLERYQPTVFYSVPTSYVALLHYAEKTGRTSLGRVRLCISAGEPLPKHTFEQWRARFGVDILDGIGSTEILHIYISNRPGDVLPGSTGQIVPGYEARIVDRHGHPLPPGQVGTLLVKGDSIAAGYWNNHERTKDTFHGHWINTHDKFLMDENGFFWYAGRADDMFKVSGQAVWPADVESVLLRHDAVLESGVVGATGPDGLVKPVAFVVLRDPQQANDELKRDLQNFVKSTTNPHKYPRAVVFVEELPKTATGKIKRFQLRAQAQQQQLLANP